MHADTHGQSAAIFGLAYILGIQLMPRIRNWKHLVLYRSTKETRYQHIDGLFTGVVDWDLIATHLPDMLRVGVSIAAGTISPSTILRRLGTYSRKNRLYLAFRELGVSIACHAAPVVVSSGTGGGAQSGKGPQVAHSREPLVLYLAVEHDELLAARTCNRGGASICLKATGVGEASGVVADLSQQTCRGQLAQPREASSRP